MGREMNRSKKENCYGKISPSASGKNNMLWNEVSLNFIQNDI